MNTPLKYLKKILLVSILYTTVASCSASKVVKTPMHVVASVASIVPIVGDEIDEGLTKGAKIIDII